MGETTLHLFFRGRNYFGRHGGERARPLYTLNIYFTEVVITLGITLVRWPDHTQHVFFRGRNYFERDCGERARPLNIYFLEVVIIILGKMRPLHLFFVRKHFQDLVLIIFN